MSEKPAEWLKQADYDVDTAELMFRGGRYFYAIFMCHLSVEKALKGLYVQRLKEVPPKTHNLVYLVEKIKIELPESLYDLAFTLNRVSIPTRYPDNLDRMLKDYDKAKTKDMLKKCKELVKWLREKL